MVGNIPPPPAASVTVFVNYIQLNSFKIKPQFSLLEFSASVIDLAKNSNESIRPRLFDVRHEVRSAAFITIDIKTSARGNFSWGNSPLLGVGLYVGRLEGAGGKYQDA